MNPSGDFGKRELSPALRNRFTEIWCTSISCCESLSLFDGKQFFFTFCLKMIKSCLWELCSDVSLLNNIARAICNLFVWVNVSWKGILKPLSIRDLKSIMELIRGMWSDIGNHSIFATVHLIIEAQLGVSQAHLVRLKMLGQVRKSLSDMFSDHLILKTGLSMFQNLELQIANDVMSINDVSLSRNAVFNIANPSQDPYVLTNQKVLSNLIRVMMGLKSSKAILMEGPPGVGKTSLVLHLGKLLGKKVHRINLNEQTDLLDLLGFDVPDPDRPGKLFYYWVFIVKFHYRVY